MEHSYVIIFVCRPGERCYEMLGVTWLLPMARTKLRGWQGCVCGKQFEHIIGYGTLHFGVAARRCYLLWRCYDDAWRWQQILNGASWRRLDIIDTSPQLCKKLTTAVRSLHFAFVCSPSCAMTTCSHAWSRRSRDRIRRILPVLAIQIPMPTFPSAPPIPIV
jgi:hypothetical protein